MDTEDRFEDRERAEAEGWPFDAFEVGAVVPVEVIDPGHGSDGYERIDTDEQADEYAAHILYTVYGHRSGMGIWAIGDFSAHSDALAMARALAATAAGVSVYDTAPLTLAERVAEDRAARPAQYRPID